MKYNITKSATEESPGQNTCRVMMANKFLQKRNRKDKMATESGNKGNQQPESIMSEILTSLVNLQRNAQLPRRDLDIFDGNNVLEFPAFLKTFRCMVE